MKDKKTERAITTLENGGRILVTRLQYLGDVILTLPLVDAIRDRFPRADVDYLCRPPSSDLLAGDVRFANVYSVKPGENASDSFARIRQLRSRHYDVVIDLYSNPRSAWISWFTGAKMRIGGDRRGRRRLYTHPVTVPPNIRSAMEFHMKYAGLLDISAPSRKPVLLIAPGEIEAARDRLQKLGVETRRPSRPRIGLHPGGKWEVKRWPVSSFAALAEMLRKTWDAEVVAFTGPGEDQYTDRLVEAAGDSVTVLPEMDIRSVAAVLSLLDGMVVSDGGIMHLSVAVGTPTVGIFGSAEPDIWFPYESFGPFTPVCLPLECRPCHRHVCPLGHTACLNDLTAETVLESLHKVMAGQRPPLDTIGEGP